MRAESGARHKLVDTNTISGWKQAMEEDTIKYFKTYSLGLRSISDYLHKSESSAPLTPNHPYTHSSSSVITNSHKNLKSQRQ